MKLNKSTKKIIIFVLIIAVVVIANHFLGLSSYLKMEKLMELKTVVADNFLLAAVIYVVATVAGSVLLALPGVSFAIAAGILFGAFWGTLLCTLAASIGAIVAFIAGRFFLRDQIKPMAMKNKYLKKYLFDDMKKNGVFVLMITRLVPLFPFNLQNFAYGITDIKLSTYSIFTFIFILPGTAMYTVGTAGFADSKNRVLYIGIAIGLAVVVFLTAYLFRKYVVDKEMPEEIAEENKESPEKSSE